MLMSCATPGGPSSAVVQSIVPNTAAGTQLHWVLEVLNDFKGKTTLEELREHFTEVMLGKISAQQLMQIFGQVGTQITPFVVKSIEESPDKSGMVAHGDTPAGKFKIYLNAEAESQGGRMRGLSFAQESEPTPPLKFFSEPKR